MANQCQWIWSISIQIIPQLGHLIVFKDDIFDINNIYKHEERKLDKQDDQDSVEKIEVKVSWSVITYLSLEER